MPSELERIEEKQETQKLYMRSIALMKYVDDLRTMARIADTKDVGSQNKSSVPLEVFEKIENADLKTLLQQTS